jgi:hypothetical protein
MTSDLIVMIGIAVAAAAWIGFAEHPMARNLRRAIIDTLELG